MGGMGARTNDLESPAAYGEAIPETTVEVAGLRYAIGEKVLLENVAMVFEPGHLTALMGPSGAGKTTLMNVVSGRAGGTVAAGGVYVNGARATAATLRLLMSYMPQDDVLYPALTVRQTLRYATLLRCPEHWKASAKLARADDIAAKLGLHACADGVVGDHGVAGAISGGQKRRLSAAIEFLSFRPVMLMDEPTSGLDSPSAINLVRLLHDSANVQGRTVLCTIHQPSWVICSLFDPLLLLGAGGKQVYDGPVAGLPGWFAAGGAPCPRNENPADHALYVLARESTDAWHARWRDARPKKAQKAVKERDGGDGDELDDASAYPISAPYQYRLLLERAVHLWVTDRSQGPLSWAMLLFSTVVFSSSYFQLHICPTKVLAVTVYLMAIFQATTNPLCVIMPLERAVVLRGYRNGVFAAAPYWLARATLALGNGVVAATLTTCIAYPSISAPFKGFLPLKFWAMIMLFVLGSTFVGLIVGIASPSAFAAVKTVPPILVLQLLFSKILIPTNKMKPWFYPLSYPNLITWAGKSLLVTQYAHMTDKAEEILTSPDYFDISVGNADSCFLAMILINAFLFVAGFHVTRARLDKPDGAGAAVAAAKTAARKPAAAAAAAATRDDDAAEPLIDKADPGYGAADESLVARPMMLEARRVTLVRGVGTATERATLHDVSMTFCAKTTTALMGPSGAGKTTLVDVLTGRTKDDDRVEGAVLCNGAVAPRGECRYFSTVTPQDDVLLADLTVRETLELTAELRCDRDWAPERKRARAAAVLAQLGLGPKADVVVGSVLRPGLSGGQKKRVSIGMDLLADCSVMCLDEPTTGLDAAAALAIANVVLGLSRETGRTMICTIHQPTWEMISCFDTLAVLVGGRAVFAEPPAKLEAFFAAGGAVCPANENPVDFAMFRLQEDGGGVWADRWAAASRGAAPDAPKLPPAAPAAAADPVGELFGRYPVSQVAQYRILLKRAAISYFRDEDQFVEHLMPSLVNGLLSGLSYLNFGTNIYLGFGISMAIMGVIMMSFNAFILNIPMERTLIIREYKNGTFSASAYWAARLTLASLASAAVGAVATPIWWGLMGLPVGRDPARLATATAAIAIAAATYGTFASIAGLVAPNAVAAAQTAEPIITMLALTGGVHITTPQIRVYWKWLHYINPCTYVYEMVIVDALQNRHGTDKAEEVLDYFHYKDGTYDHNLLWLLLIWAAAAAAGFKIVQWKFASL